MTCFFAKGAKFQEIWFSHGNTSMRPVRASTHQRAEQPGALPSTPAQPLVTRPAGAAPGRPTPHTHLAPLKSSCTSLSTQLANSGSDKAQRSSNE